MNNLAVVRRVAGDCGHSSRVFGEVANINICRIICELQEPESSLFLLL